MNDSIKKTIMFPKTTRIPREYYGRNGFGKCFGLDLWSNDGRVRFSPVNSTGRTTASMIDVPHESIPELIEFLKTINPTNPNPTNEDEILVSLQ
jgi:hypothetical protein